MDEKKCSEGGALAPFKTLVYHLACLDLYQDEKPYMITFDASNFGGEKTNHRYTENAVLMSDARAIQDRFTLNVHGFEFHSWPTTLCSAHFDDEEAIRDRYYPELLIQMHKLLPEAYISPLGTSICRYCVARS
jgi:hypothetical protein